jgi:hypothetical protein
VARPACLGYGPLWRFNSFSRHPGFSTEGFSFSQFLRFQRRPLLPFRSRPAPVTAEFSRFFRSKSSVPRQRFAGSSALPLDFSSPEPALCVSLPRARFLLLRSALLSFVPRPRGSDTGAALFLRSSCCVCPSASICFVRQAVAQLLSPCVHGWSFPASEQECAASVFFERVGLSSI